MVSKKLAPALVFALVLVFAVGSVGFAQADEAALDDAPPVVPPEDPPAEDMPDEALPVEVDEDVDLDVGSDDHRLMGGADDDNLWDEPPAEDMPPDNAPWDAPPFENDDGELRGIIVI